MQSKKGFLILLVLVLGTGTITLFIPRNLNATIYGSISGKVIDKLTNQGIKGVKIGLWCPNRRHMCAETTTDKNGSFRFEMLRPGNYKLRFYPEPPYAYEDKFDEINLEKGEIIVNFIKVLNYGGAIAGTVYDGDGITPLEGMRVSAYSGISWATSWTDNQGHYRIEKLLPDNNYKVEIEQDGYINKIIKGVKVIREEVTSLDIIFDLNDPTGVEGTVTSAIDGEPLAEIALGLQKKDEKEVLGLTETDQEGKFSIVGAKQGLYTLSIRDIKEGIKTTKHYDILIQHGKKTKIDIVLNIHSIAPQLKVGTKNVFACFFVQHQSFFSLPIVDSNLTYGFFPKGENF